MSRTSSLLSTPCARACALSARCARTLTLARRSSSGAATIRPSPGRSCGLTRFVLDGEVHVEPRAQRFEGVDLRGRDLPAHDSRDRRMANPRLVGDLLPTPANAIEVAAEDGHNGAHGQSLGKFASSVKAHLPTVRRHHFCMGSKGGPPVQKVIADNLRALMDAGRHGLRTQEAIAEAAKKAGFPIDQKSV